MPGEKPLLLNDDGEIENLFIPKVNAEVKVISAGEDSLRRKRKKNNYFK